MWSYCLLFGSAFLAATLLPFYSEIVLVSLLIQEKPAFALWLTATLGNTLGATVNWWLGRSLLRFHQHRWFPFKPAQMARSQRWFQRYGIWSLLFSWLPVGGDALTFIAGTMRVPAPVFLILTALGKGARYAVVISLTELTV